MTLEKMIISYDGIWDLSFIDEPNKIAYTCMKSKSSGAMDQEEFNKYVYVGYRDNKQLYMHQDEFYKTIKK